MSNTLPLNIEFGALPPSLSCTPQQLGDAIAERLRITTQQTFALFVTGSTEPSSNVGPWLKNGTTWYVWSNITGNYVPATVDQQSLGYIISSSAPDPSVYQFWIETTVGGSPLAIKTYYSGAWVDVYAATLASYQTIAAYNASIANYSTTAAMNSAIAAAVGAIPASVVGGGSFRVKPSAVQDVVFGSGATQSGTVLLGTETFDPDGVFASNTFVAPAAGYYQFNAALSCSVSSGTPTSADLRGFIAVNGALSESLNDEPITTSLNGRIFVGSTYFQLALNDQVTLRYQFTVDAACTVTIDDAYTRLSGYRVR